MLRTLSELHNYTIGAVDGVVGHVKDLYLDDEAWVVRYLVVDTGHWLASRKVLISPMAIGEPDWAKRLLPVSITQEQVRNSPDFDSDKPVTRQHEMDYAGYYAYPFYWGGTGYWGAGMYPNMGYRRVATQHAMQQEAQYARAEPALDENADPHLRSCAAVTGYHIRASDGDIGHVSGMLIDDETWAVRYLIVDTSNWWLGHHMLVAPQWIKSVSWAEGAVSVKLTRQAVKDAPVFEPDKSPTREDEMALYEHYGHGGYWAAGGKPVTEAEKPM